MFEKETIFVLGAGASWHYGYPTGEELVGEVVDLAKSLASECESHTAGRYRPPLPSYVVPPEGCNENSFRRSYWVDLAKSCHDLVSRLETVRPLVIDYFLGWNPTLQSLGKLLIAGVILKCEAQFEGKSANINRIRLLERSAENPTPEQLRRVNLEAFKDNWYRFIIHKLASNCIQSSDLLNNKVRFITFNYDCSLERHLQKSLSAMDIFNADDVEKFLSNERIIHVYGCLREKPYSDDFAKAASFLANSAFMWIRLGNENSHESPWLRFLEVCHLAAKGIRTIDPGDKVQDDIQKKAKEWLITAPITYILGYGFDSNNNDRIGLEALATNYERRYVYFTNYRDANSVNKKVGQIFGNMSYFLNNSIARDRGNTFEKSVRDVYEALELDFGLA